MDRPSSDRSTPADPAASSTDADERRTGPANASKCEDWHARHARTSASGDDRPTVKIDRFPDECDWHVRHGHVRRLAGK